jgi:hypothetical protein
MAAIGNFEPDCNPEGNKTADCKFVWVPPCEGFPACLST